MTEKTNQKEFEGFCSEIKDLQLHLNKITESLDLALASYQEKVLPAKKALVLALMDCSKRMYRHYKHPLSLSLEELINLKVLIANTIHQILAENSDAEIIFILEDLVEKQPLHPKRVPEEFFFRQEPAAEQELAKTNRKHNLNSQQKKELAFIYKRLAKVFHPDLEIDPNKKLEKEDLMKNLTQAYENNDLFELLSLEKKWLGDAERKEPLVVYNSILQNQIAALQNEIQGAYRSPKYWPLHGYGSNDYETLMLKIEETCQFVKNEAEECQKIAEVLEGSFGEQLLSRILAQKFS